MKIRLLLALFEKLRQLLKWDGKERAAFILCNRSSSATTTTLLAHKVFAPQESDYIFRSAGYCEIRKPFINMVFNEAASTQSDVIKVHTHPPGYPAVYSPVDEQHEPEFLRHVASQIEGIELASLVFDASLESCDGWFLDKKTSSLQPVEKVVIVGPERLEVLIPHRSPLNGKTLPPELNRTALAFGEDRARKFGRLDIGIIGASGLGAPTIELVSLDRPNKLMICDPDYIEVTNLNRLPGVSKKDIGKNKALHYAELACSISPDTNVIAYPTSFYDLAVQQAFAQADVVIAGVDSGARLAINQLSLSHLVPYFDLGASIQIEDGNPTFIGGQIYSVIPSRGSCLSCSGVFDSLRNEYLPPKMREANVRQGYIRGDDNEIDSPLVGHLDFTIASLGYHEFLKYVLGFQEEPSFKVYFDQLSYRISRSNFKAGDCIVCSDDGYLGKGDRAPFLCPQEDLDESAILLILQEKAVENEKADPATDETTISQTYGV